jgi:RimJ/RimL family protein N-acetyltransferase
MRHNLTIDGPAFRLRPVCLEDAGFIAQLRADPERSRYLHPAPPGLDPEERTIAQARWLETYFERAGDYYFILENRTTGEPEGTAGIYNVDPLARDAEWGRWVLRRRSLAAVESACLVYHAGFRWLYLDSLYCRTIRENAAAVAFHDSFGLTRARVLPAYLDGMDAIESRLTATRWMALREGVEGKALRAAAWSRPDAPEGRSISHHFGMKA